MPLFDITLSSASVFDVALVDPEVSSTPVAPTNVIAPVISGDTVEGSVLTTTNGTWSGSPSPTYTYQWRANGSNISGATASTYTTVTADVGDTITCQVTGTNTEGSASAVSNGIVVTAIPEEPEPTGFLSKISILKQASLNVELIDSDTPYVFDVDGGFATEDRIILVTVLAGYNGSIVQNIIPTIGGVAATLVMDIPMLGISDQQSLYVFALQVPTGTGNISCSILFDVPDFAQYALVITPYVIRGAAWPITVTGVRETEIGPYSPLSLSSAAGDSVIAFGTYDHISEPDTTMIINGVTRPTRRLVDVYDIVGNMSAEEYEVDGVSTIETDSSADFIIAGIALTPTTVSYRNPLTIMGHNALTAIDVTKGGMFQNSSATTPATIGDSVYKLRDLVSGFYDAAGDAYRPVLRDGYLEFRGISKGLSKLQTRSGQFWIGMQLSYTSTGDPSVLRRSLVMAADTGTWWFDTSSTIMLEENRNFTPPLMYALSGLDTYTEYGNFSRPTEYTIQNGIRDDGVSQGYLNGGFIFSDTGNVLPTTNIITLGGGLSGGVPDETSNFDLVRFYVLDQEPTTDQRVALGNWLKYGEIKPPITSVGPQVFSQESATTLTLDINTGLASDDRIILIAVSGDGRRTAVSGNFGGVSTTLLASEVGTGDVDHSLHIFAAVVPTGDGVQTCSMTFSDGLFSVVSAAWVIRGAQLPAFSSGSSHDGSFPFQSSTTLDAPEDGYLLGIAAVGAGNEGAFSLGSVPLDTQKQVNWYGSQNVHIISRNPLSAATGQTLSQDTNFNIATAAVILEPLSAGPPPVEGTIINYWSGSAWVPAPLFRWSGTEWVSATLQRWNGSAWVYE